mmetsp:Transcript_19446/g.39133  ORF Transcript_19446/g.39133 Transcript_19446/m.39133 type:complete len:105 (-) Transcript_19446:269-583(-)
MSEHDTVCPATGTRQSERKNEQIKQSEFTSDKAEPRLPRSVKKEFRQPLSIHACGKHARTQEVLPWIGWLVNIHLDHEKESEEGRSKENMNTRRQGKYEKRIQC